MQKVKNIGESVYAQWVKVEKREETERLGMEITKSKARQKVNQVCVCVCVWVFVRAHEGLLCARNGCITR